MLRHLGAAVDEGQRQDERILVDRLAIVDAESRHPRQALDGVLRQDILDPQIRVRRDDRRIHDVHAGPFLLVAHPVEEPHLVVLRRRCVIGDGGIIVSQRIVEAGRHAVAVIIACARLRDPVEPGIARPDLRDLRLLPDGIRAVLLHRFGGIAPEQDARIDRQLQKGHRDQRDRADPAHVPAACRRHDGRKDPEHGDRQQAQHACHQHPAAPTRCEGPLGDHQHCRGSRYDHGRKGRRHSRRGLHPRPRPEIGGRKEQDREAADIPVAVPVAVHILQQRENIEQRLPVERQQREQEEESSQHALGGRIFPAGEEGEASHERQAPAEEGQRRDRAHLTDAVVPDEPQQVAAHPVDHVFFRIERAALASAQDRDRGKEQRRADHHADAHRETEAHRRREQTHGRPQRRPQRRPPVLAPQPAHLPHIAEERQVRDLLTDPFPLLPACRRCRGRLRSGLSAGCRRGSGRPALLYARGRLPPVQPPEHIFKHEPHDRIEAVHAGAVPVEQDGQAHGDRQSQDPAAAHAPVDPQQDQRQHVHAVQPHHVAALRQVVLHQRIAGRQQDHDPLRDMVLKAPLQEPGEGPGGRRQLQRHDEIQEGIHLRLLEEQDEQVEGRGQIVAEQPDRVHAQRGRERVPDRILPRQHVLQVGEEIQILDPRIPCRQRPVPVRRAAHHHQQRLQNTEGQKKRDQHQHQSPLPADLLLPVPLPVRSSRHRSLLCPDNFTC